MRHVTPLGNQGMYILDTASWRTVRPVMDKKPLRELRHMPHALSRGQHLRRRQADTDFIRLLQGLRHLRRGVPEAGDNDGSGGEVR